MWPQESCTFSILPSRMVPTPVQMQQAGRSEAQTTSLRHFAISQLSLAFLRELPPTRLSRCGTAELTTQRCQPLRERSRQPAGHGQHLGA